MIQKLEIDGLDCLCCSSCNKARIAYILYPMDILADWIETAAASYNTTIVVVTGMDWQNVFSPWPAKGVPNGTPDFKGEAPGFLDLLRYSIIPKVETVTGCSEAPQRTLFGVSMSGLFALWQWVVCDTFGSIACLSGSFWYEGFVDWIKSRPLPSKRGKAFFLLGDKEACSKVKAFGSVAADTQAVIARLNGHGIVTEFISVPGNHYSDPLPRLDRAFAAIYCRTGSYSDQR